MIETVSKTCPTCDVTFDGLNADVDHWYCENDDCPTEMFGEKGVLSGGEWVEA